MQPFNEDHRRPCCIIDNTDVLPYLCDKYGLVPTHEGGERVATDLNEMLERNSEAYGRELESRTAEAKTSALSK